MKLAVVLAGCAVLLLSAASQAAQHGVGLAIGGYGAVNTVELVTADQTCRGSRIDPPFQVSPSGNSAWIAEYVDNAIYLCGGQNIDQRKDCYKLDFAAGNGVFRPACPMTTNRRYPTSLVFEGQMVVMGGYNDMQGWLDSVDVKAVGGCDFSRKEEWKLRRGMYNFCAVSHAGKIYTIGGTVHEMFDNSDIKNVDVLDTATNTWSAAADLPRSREAAACMVTSLKGEEGILVAGGCDDSCLEKLDDTLFYSFKTGSWRVLSAKLNTKRTQMKMVDVGGKPTVIGGYSDGTLHTIEEFDGDKWVVRPDQLHDERYAYGMPSFLPENVVKCKK